jgi:hypothetical protein
MQHTRAAICMKDECMEGMSSHTSGVLRQFWFDERHFNRMAQRCLGYCINKPRRININSSTWRFNATKYKAQHWTWSYSKNVFRDTEHMRANGVKNCALLLGWGTSTFGWWWCVFIIHTSMDGVLFFWPGNVPDSRATTQTWHYMLLTERNSWLWRMASSGMLRLVDLVRTDVSEELST